MTLHDFPDLSRRDITVNPSWGFAREGSTHGLSVGVAHPFVQGDDFIPDRLGLGVDNGMRVDHLGDGFIRWRLWRGPRDLQTNEGPRAGHESLLIN